MLLEQMMWFHSSLMTEAISKRLFHFVGAHIAAGNGRQLSGFGMNSISNIHDDTKLEN